MVVAWAHRYSPAGTGRPSGPGYDPFTCLMGHSLPALRLLSAADAIVRAAKVPLATNALSPPAAWCRQ